MNVTKNRPHRSQTPVPDAARTDGPDQDLVTRFAAIGLRRAGASDAEISRVLGTTPVEEPVLPPSQKSWIEAIAARAARRVGYADL